MVTERQIEEAKEYLRRRIKSEISMQNDIERLLTEYARLLAEVIMRNGGSYEDNPDVELLVQDLISRILEDCYILGVDERDDRDGIIAYMDSERAGKTLRERVVERCNSFVREVASTVAAGISLRLGLDEIEKAITGNLKTPWQNDIIKEAMEEGLISIEIPSFGKGREISSMGALQTITGYAVADAWMWSLFQSNKEAKGYYVYRGSSYPCDECDEAVQTGPHPITDWEHFVPLHPHCKCFVVFI